MAVKKKLTNSCSASATFTHAQRGTRCTRYPNFFAVKFIKELTAHGRQFIVTKWAVLNSVTHPVSVNTSSVCTAVLMTSTCYNTKQSIQLVDMCSERPRTNANAPYGLVVNVDSHKAVLSFPTSLRCTHNDSPQCHFATIPHKATLASIGVCARACTRGICDRLSRKRLKIHARFQWDTNTKWHMSNPNFTSTSDSY